MPTNLWKGARRLPYFYTVLGDNNIVCPQCALEHLGAEELEPRYVAARSLMCCRCGILMGPINKAESEATDE